MQIDHDLRQDITGRHLIIVEDILELPGVDLRLQHADVRDIPVQLGVVQAIAYHELVGHREAGEIGGGGLRDGLLGPGAD